MFSHAHSGSPEEVCGWLAGEGGRVSRVLPVPNAAAEPTVTFVMDPEAQLSTMRRIREERLEIVGTYHSHPRSPARPSARDSQLAAYPEAAHLIVSLAAPDPEACCYRIDAQGFTPIELHVKVGITRSSKERSVSEVWKAPEPAPPERLEPTILPTTVDGARERATKSGPRAASERKREGVPGQLDGNIPCL